MIHNEEFIQEFIVEAKEHLDAFDRVLLTPLKEIDEDAINRAFRSVHSIKGTAGFFGLNKIVEISHIMETILDEVNRKLRILSDKDIDMLLKANDMLRSLVNDALNSESYQTDDIVFQLQLVEINTKNATNNHLVGDETIGAFTDLSQVEINEEIQTKIMQFRKKGHFIYAFRLPVGTKRTDDDGGINQLIENLKAVANIFLTTNEKGHAIILEDLIDSKQSDSYVFIIASSILEEHLFAQAIDIQPGQLSLITETIEFSNQYDDNLPYEKSLTPQIVYEEKVDNIRVNIKLLDELMNLTSELVLGKNRLLTLLDEKTKVINGLPETLQVVNRLTNIIQEKVMLTRMQPVGTLFNKYPRVIRELNKKMNKQIELQIEGSDIELDRSILERLSDPIVHLIRNAADHGIESTVDRKEIGKPESGTILLKATYEGSYVSVEIIDDGKGIDIERVSKKAIELKLYSQVQLNEMTEKEIYNIIFHPSFSTSDAISEVSGRGVGMDVVKTNIDRLGGNIDITSKQKKGTKIKLTFPLTVSIIQTLLVWSDGVRMVIPQKDVQETLKVNKDQIKIKIEEINGRFYYRLRNDLLPVFFLTDLWSADYSVDRAKDLKIVVLKQGNKRFGLIVEELVGHEETLIKPLPSLFKSCGIYSGMTIMGDGKVSPIIDVVGLGTKLGVDLLTGHGQAFSQTGREYNLTNEEDFVLFRGFGNEILGLNIALIKRIEKIKASRIETIGEYEYVTLGNEVLRVIYPHEYLPVSSGEDTVEELFVIIPKLVSHPIGILVKAVVENVRFEPILDTTYFNSKGIFGSAVYKEKIILIINLYELFEEAAPEFYTFSTSHKVERKRILLVEDSKFFQQVEQKYLEKAGYEVIHASDGREALEVLDNQKVDIVLTDIQMPNLNGFELLRKIRQNKNLREIPVIALTSLTGDKHREIGLKSGFDRYEFKLDRDTLLHTLEDVISKAKKEDENV